MNVLAKKEFTLRIVETIYVCDGYGMVWMVDRVG